ncbi:MAG: 3-methyl-2-oxobutanoate hydroxymethyltransferase, partial [Alphaproteobacteria bacterium]
MSTESKQTTTGPKALTVPDIVARKGKTPIVCLTAYSTPQAEAVDAHCDLVLVGDSVAMVVHGLPSTIGATLEMMIMHGAAVRRGLKRALMVVDMPFGSYEESPEQAFRNSARVMAETGCAAVKIEGGERMRDTIRFLTDRGIPVMAHVGLTPQSVNVFGGFRLQGKSRDAARVEADARAVTEAGAFSVVLEKIPAALAERITRDTAIPTIGIGASPACDGQILVIDDILGHYAGFRPKFVKRYAELGTLSAEAVAAYATDGGHMLARMRWGLVPPWWKKPLRELPATFNARAETVAEK